MNWLNELVFGLGIAHSMFVFALVISLGIVLGRIKIFGVSLGITWILFVGIVFGHFGLLIDQDILHFMKEFGLVIFIYSIGMQVGPSFFSSFKKGGLTLNLLATSIIVLGAATAYVIHLITNLPISTMVGILSGAVTNTPGLGAAQQTFQDISGTTDPTMSMGYAVAYPLGVVGVITSLILLRYIFKINLDKETGELESQNESELTKAQMFSLEINNPAIFGKTLSATKPLINKEFVISRIQYAADNKLEVANPETILNKGDKVLVVSNLQNIGTVSALLGKNIDMDQKEWAKLGSELISRRIIITKPDINGRTIDNLNLRKIYDINVTRVNRAGLDLIADPQLQLQLGDRLTVVGSKNSVSNIEKLLGNSLKRLHEPNLVSIFIGIALGVLLGSIPFMIPGMPQPVKLGLAGGPLIVSILMSKFGPRYKLVTYTTMSANLMLREIGISLFLACVGLEAGEGFVRTIMNGGYLWVGYGAVITILPVLIVGAIGRYVFKINYFTLMGLISGSMTDPPALAFANTTAGNDTPAASYATVYPLTMFLRVVTAQILILLYI
ncbi:MAG: putative transporter [Desulfobacterium sp.]|jgi:putative transport protein|nr:putative transporter [Desulfobacterium sp.]